jgi:hypothetical protein
MNTNPGEKAESFKPKGAIAFFIVLILMTLALWYGLYFFMVNKA